MNHSPSNPFTLTGTLSSQERFFSTQCQGCFRREKSGFWMLLRSIDGEGMSGVSVALSNGEDEISSLDTEHAPHVCEPLRTEDLIALEKQVWCSAAFRSIFPGSDMVGAFGSEDAFIALAVQIPCGIARQ